MTRRLPATLAAGAAAILGLTSILVGQDKPQARLQGHADAPRRQVARPRRRPAPAARHHPRHAQHAGGARARHRPTRSSSSTARTCRSWRSGDGNRRRGRSRTAPWSSRPRRARAGSITTKDEFGDCQLHVEWAAPTPPKGRDQGRGNSGIDHLRPVRDPGARLLREPDLPRRPGRRDLRPVSPPGQRLPAAGPVADVRHHLHRAPVQGRRLARVAGLRDACFTTACSCTTTRPSRRDGLSAASPKYTPHDPKGPIVLQDHGNPVRYRNIWVRPIKGYDEP